MGQNRLQAWAKTPNKGGSGSFDEDKHTRDDKGKFSSTGGGGGSEKPGGAPIEGKREWTDKLPAGMKAETWMSHYDKSPWEGGKPSDERYATIHKPLIDKALDVKPAAYGEQKMAILTMGAPASGKSSALRGIDTSRYVKVDPDALMEHIPEYKAAIADRNNTFSGAANMAHTEAADIGDHVQAAAMKAGNHLVIDGTGFNAKSMSDRIQALQAAGYHVHLAMPHLEAEEGEKRALARANSSGRMVPPEFVSAAYKVIPRNFGRLAHLADSAALFDNSGKAPRMVFETKKGHKDTVHDPDFMRHFRAKHSG